MPSPWKLGDEGIPEHSLASGAHDGAHSPSNPHVSVAEECPACWLDIHPDQCGSAHCPKRSPQDGVRPDATDLFEALEAALVEGTPTLALQAGRIWIDGETAFDARAVLAALAKAQGQS